jgi:HPr kinase/phosphorylase
VTGILVHATSVHLPGLGGALVSGPPGSGKSDLALRLIDEGALLVADDQTVLAVEAGRLIARAPATISGQIEVRGVGIIRVPSIAATQIDAAFAMVSAAEIERLPTPQLFALPKALAAAGLALPLFPLAPFESSAPAKVRAALSGLKRLFRHDTGPQ